MAHRKKKRKPKNSNVKNLKKPTIITPNLVERDIEKFKFYSVVVQLAQLRNLRVLNV